MNFFRRASSALTVRRLASSLQPRRAFFQGAAQSAFQRPFIASSLPTDKLTAVAAVTAAAAAAAAAYSNTLAASDAAPPIEVERVTLSDGRILAYRILGDPDGVPIVCLHGMSSSHLTWVPKSGSLESLAPGVRIIAIDRPGYGGSSDPPACYSYAHFCRDLDELASALQMPHFCVAGHSSGGPYALAAAALLPERVLACAAVSSDPPYNHPRCPDVVRVSDSMASDQKGGFYGRDAVQKVSKWRAQVMEGSDAAKQWAWRPGVLGFVTDFTLERIPWSFKIEDVQLGERLTFWYGSKDYDPMILGSPWMASLVPGSQVRVVEGGKHSFKSEPAHLSAILSELREQAKSAAYRERLDVAFTL